MLTAEHSWKYLGPPQPDHFLLCSKVEVQPPYTFVTFRRANTQGAIDTLSRLQGSWACGGRGGGEEALGRQEVAQAVAHREPRWGSLRASGWKTVEEGVLTADGLSTLLPAAVPRQRSNVHSPRKHTGPAKVSTVILFPAAGLTEACALHQAL